MVNKIGLKVLSLLISLTALLVLDSCKKTIEDPPPPKPVPESGFFVVCEGNFNWGNASITNFNESKDEVSTNYFELINGFSLGDVAQSIAENEDKYFIVVNNSSKIEVLAKNDFSSLYSITNLGSPRYFQAINDSIAYVSDLWNNALHVINYNSGNLLSDIPVNGWSEQMVKLEDSVYVCLTDAKSIAIINTLNNSIVSEIPLNYSPQSIRLDKNNILWVLTSDFNGTSALYRIDTENRNIDFEWVFSVNSTLNYIDLPPESDHLYLAYSNGMITKIALTQFPVITSLFTADFDGMYGFNVNKEGEVYILEAHDFVQNGTVSKYTDNGVLLYSFESGINPNSILFR